MFLCPTSKQYCHLTHQPRFKVNDALAISDLIWISRRAIILGIDYGANWELNYAEIDGHCADSGCRDPFPVSGCEIDLNFALPKVFQQAAEVVIPCSNSADRKSSLFQQRLH